MKRTITAIATILMMTTSTVSAYTVKSHKTGATANVSAEAGAKFQQYIDALESEGATIRFMGGYRRGRCWSGGLHPCGLALDVCQLSRGSVDARCHLPSRSAIAQVAARFGLFEGGQWCHSDYGHVQAKLSAGPCNGNNLYAAVEKFHTTFHARRYYHHRKIRIASRHHNS